MKLLAVDTSTERCSVALALGGEVHADEIDAGQRHSRLLNGMIVALLARHGLQVTDLEGLAFGSGPGSFTGLRIACSVVQGMALGLDCKVAAVGTLEALAEQAASAHADTSKVITALDARMGESYFAAWERVADGWHAVVAPCLVRPDALPALDGEGWVAIGSAFDRQENVAAHFAPHVATVLPGRFPSAREVATLALRIFARGEAVSPEQALPLYIRDKVAMTIAERNALKSAKAAAEIGA
ncbi:MAG: tRNA (adenosine(37)-N6)-threonylcarbamoyltransferase complex dimerization subunit type 1 TsaB [Betaproteobacteria bacterium]|nr:tRNA (adenosine(37)-N6)-threonylcarbamoyltransferase complex dimerization subunit type 1 TsaB [Betaproteobacteria bacterium]